VTQAVRMVSMLRTSCGSTTSGNRVGRVLGVGNVLSLFQRGAGARLAAASAKAGVPALLGEGVRSGVGGLIVGPLGSTKFGNSLGSLAHVSIESTFY
jgi:hypothetical protein